MQWVAIFFVDRQLISGCASKWLIFPVVHYISCNKPREEHLPQRDSIAINEYQRFCMTLL